MSDDQATTTGTVYRALVADGKLTCSACPVQWEGRLNDGRYFYFRYRSGWASLEIGDSIEAVEGIADHGIQHGDSLDGSMGDDEYRAMFVRLYEEYWGPAARGSAA